MKKLIYSFYLAIFPCLLFGQNVNPAEIVDPKGAIIIAQLEGEVSIINNSTGIALPPDRVKSGGILFDGHTVKTGNNAKVVLLLSNGTVSTLKADSVLNIKKFTQSKFDPGATKLSELEGEPSSSDVVIDLNLGDMVVDIKKLDKKSSFNIESPVGTAGIRGTRVGMNIQQAPGGGFTSKVTVPEGTIAFTPPPPPPSPPGVAPPPPPEPVSVTAGQAVTPSVTSTGTVSAPPVPAPAPPADLASIDADLDTAVATTADVSMAEVSTAVSEVAAESPTEAPAEPAPSEEPAEEPSDEPSDEPAPADEPSDEPAPADEPSDEPAPADAPSDEPAPVDAPSDEPAPVDAPPADAPPADATAPPTADAPATEAPPPVVPVLDDSAIRESDPSMKQAQKGGPRREAKDAILAEALEATGTEDVEAAMKFVEAVENSLGLGIDISDQLSNIGTLSKDDLDSKKDFAASQNDLVSAGILSVDAAKSRADNAKSKSAAELLAETESNKEITEKVASGEITADDAKKKADNQTAASASPELQALLDELNKLNLSDDEMASVLKDLEQGPNANPPGSPPNTITSLSLQEESQMLTLLEDITLSGKIDSTLFMAANKASASVFFQDLDSTYEALSALDKSNSEQQSGSPAEDDYSDTDDNDMVLARSDVTVPNGSYDLETLPGNGDYFIAASNKFTLLGNVVFNSPSSDASLILLSANSVDLSGTSSITFTGEELGIGSFDTLNVENVSLKAEGALSLRSLDSVVLDNVQMETSGKGADFIHLLAANQITADSVRFSDMVKQITMEAMTINLSNINFPSGSNVNLNSLYGGVDGKYPNFGSATQYGRVNFIKSMTYGANSVMDRTSFDLNGGNIKIGSTGN